MALIVVSLFLPKTIVFVDNSKNTRSSTASGQRPTIVVTNGGTASNGTASHGTASHGTAADVHATNGHTTSGGGTATPKDDPSSIAIPSTDGSISNSSTDEQLPIKRNAKSFDDLPSINPTRVLTKSASCLDLKSNTPSKPQASPWGQAVSTKQPSSTAKAPPAQDLNRAKAEDIETPPNDQDEDVNADKEAREVETKIGRTKTFSERPWDVRDAVRGNGGLYDAINAAVEKGEIQEKIWIGTLGMATDVIEDVKTAIADKLEHEYGCHTIFFDDTTFDGHYVRYCKTILWPALHYQMGTVPSSSQYHDHSWERYVKVNRAFADRITTMYKRGDTIWVHDYQLMLVPDMLRKALPDAKIGFFMHVAMPSSELFRCVAKRDDLLQGMLGANLIGFQTDEYRLHFLSVCSRLLGTEALEDGVQLDTRYVNVVTAPIGINSFFVDNIRQRNEVVHCINRLGRKYGDRKIVAAKVQLNRTCGARKLLLAYQRLLQDYPGWRENVVFIIIATSTNESSAAVDLLATDINDTYSSLISDPHVEIKKDCVTYSEELALLSAADCMMVTSLREGMNLTTHEFIECQNGQLGSKSYSPLVLSECSGSVSLFGKEGALTINPWYARECAQVLNTALLMQPDERKQRWQRLHAVLQRNTGMQWIQAIGERLDKVCNDHAKRDIQGIERLNHSSLQETHSRAKRSLFILDFEGTLASSSAPATISQFSPKASEVLRDLVEDSRNSVWVASAKAPQNMIALQEQVPGIGLVADNGAFFSETKLNAVTEELAWNRLNDEKACDAWKDSLRSIVRSYAEHNEGCDYVERLSSFVLYFPEAKDPSHVKRVLAESADHLNGLCQGENGPMLIEHGQLIVPFSRVNKASAASKIFARMQQKGVSPEFIFVAGGTRTGESLFQWAKERKASNEVKQVIAVTANQKGNTEASATVTGMAGLLAALEKLSSRSKEEDAKE